MHDFCYVILSSDIYGLDQAPMLLKNARNALAPVTVQNWTFLSFLSYIVIYPVELVLVVR
jgi:hypothetical protein